MPPSSSLHACVASLGETARHAFEVERFAHGRAWSSLDVRDVGGCLRLAVDVDASCRVWITLLASRADGSARWGHRVRADTIPDGGLPLTLTAMMWRAEAVMRAADEKAIADAIATTCRACGGG